jgi:hypothetical protein
LVIDTVAMFHKNSSQSHSGTKFGVRHFVLNP